MPPPPHASIGIALDEVDTPALVLDLDALERNVLRMTDAEKGSGVRLRPHAKSHKCAELARAAFARVRPRPALRRAVPPCAGLRFAGLHAYHGSVQHVRDPRERRAAIAAATEKARLTKTLIENSGIACETVTGAGTGTFMLESASRVYNEIQPGSYVFMDADYNRNVWEEGWPRFEQSLFVLATVMSAPSPGRAVLDAGLKASSVDSGMPLVHERPGVEYVRASDEHGVLKIAAGAKAPKLGETLLLVPGHCDPPVNLYECFVCMRKGKVEALWPVTARGAVW